jgi:hypothetical protein
LKREISISKAFVPVFALFLFAASASANLIIIPTFDSSITSLSDAAAVETTINTAIAMYESTFSNNITVNITYENMTSGLGESEFNLYDIPYSTFRAAVANNSTDPSEVTALANMPACPPFPAVCDNPVTGTSEVLIKPANAAALGINVGSVASDGTVELNTSITNVSQTGPQNPSYYDLLAVVMHETDEILGLGSTLGLGLSSPYSNDPSPEDFFRYDASGNRSFTLSSSATAFFSINGTTDLAEFNQTGTGDYGDWATVPGVAPQVQDAFGTPGSDPQWGTNEILALNAVGYDLAEPEPSTWLLTISGLIFCRMSWKRSRNKA